MPGRERCRPPTLEGGRKLGTGDCPGLARALNQRSAWRRSRSAMPRGRPALFPPGQNLAPSLRLVGSSPRCAQPWHNSSPPRKTTWPDTSVTTAVLLSPTSSSAPPAALGSIPSKARMARRGSSRSSPSVLVPRTSRSSRPVSPARKSNAHPVVHRTPSPTVIAKNAGRVSPRAPCRWRRDPQSKPRPGSGRRWASAPYWWS